MGLKKFLVKPQEEVKASPKPWRGRARKGSTRPVQMFTPTELEEIKSVQRRGWSWGQADWWFHPSSLGDGCDRSLLLGMAGLRDPVTDRLTRIRDEGKCMHKRWTGYFEEAGLLLAHDVPMKNPDFLLRGTADLVVGRTEATGGLGEMKSINDNRYNRLPSPSEDPGENVTALMEVGHQSVVIQWTVYACELRHTGGFILFENKNNQEPLWFPMVLDPGVKFAVYGRMAKLRPLVLARKIPALLEGPRVCDECGKRLVCKMLPEEEHPWVKVALPGREEI